MFDAAAKVAAERRRVVWATPAVNLYVVGVLVRRQTLSLDDVDNVSRVHHEQERAQYGPLRHAELDDGRCRLLAAVTHVLPTLVQVRVANRPGFPGTVPELACGVPCPGQGRFFPEFFTKFCNTIRDAIITCARAASRNQL